MIDVATTPHVDVMNRLGAVAVGVTQEGAVVAWCVLGALAGFTVVLIAGVDPCPPELIHPISRGCDEPHM